MVKHDPINKDVVNWDEPVLKRWLDPIMKSGTKRNYRTAFRAYTMFTSMTASQLIDEALEDAKRDPREKQDIVLTKLITFYKWLKTEYPKKSKGRWTHRIIGYGVSDKVAHLYVAAMRSFYATFDITVRMKGRHRLPRPRVQNKRIKVNAEQVKVLVDHARSPRDRAVVLTHFQGGLDSSTLCSLNYGDVEEGLAKDEHPLKLEIYRPKSGVDFYTFLGKDAVEALKAYLADARARGVVFRSNTPLFIQDRGKKRLKTHNDQEMMRNLAVRAGFVDEENNGKDFNPLGPHALRESMSGLMTNSGVPDTVVDFWLGHEIGEMAKAYKGVQYESVKKMYLDREKLLSISTSKVDVEELRQKLRVEVEQQNRQLQLMVNNLVTENMDLKGRIQKTEDKLSDIERTLGELRKLIKGAGI